MADILAGVYCVAVLTDFDTCIKTWANSARAEHLHRLRIMHERIKLLHLSPHGKLPNIEQGMLFRETMVPLLRFIVFKRRVFPVFVLSLCVSFLNEKAKLRGARFAGSR
ncbi:hypothetical protein AVEN_99969-1 [Araneus ventricosus]|uniref:Uncharacterized protein n=1 Tax=Araneus ventricosus TaxID=182803 RepID=A0A4Y2QHC5_ARAVE|nr:hypothetical protein AVEN_99969-1 [Araneus ventricosus]